MNRKDEIAAILNRYGVRFVYRSRSEGRGNQYAVFSDGKQTTTAGTHAEAKQAQIDLTAQAILELFEPQS